MFASRLRAKPLISLGFATVFEPVQAPWNKGPNRSFIKNVQDELYYLMQKRQYKTITSSIHRYSSILPSSSPITDANQFKNQLGLQNVNILPVGYHGLKTSSPVAYSEQKGATEEKSSLEDSEKADLDEKDMTLFQRFRATYKKHGRTLIACHVTTSVFWFGAFYYVARSGLDIISWMEYYNFSPAVISPFKHAGLGDLAVMYLLYKLATPIRYTVTLAGTNLAIRYLKSTGYIEPVSPEDSIRGLMKDSSDMLKERRSELMDQGREKIKSMRDKTGDKTGDS